MKFRVSFRADNVKHIFFQAVRQRHIHFRFGAPTNEDLSFFDARNLTSFFFPVRPLLPADALALGCSHFKNGATCSQTATYSKNH